MNPAQPRQDKAVPANGGPLLAFDSSGPHLAAVLVRDGTVRLSRMHPMPKGQAEGLMPFLADLLTEAGLRWPDLGALAVGVGPGNFTGVRIAVSAARGLALGLGIPVQGISNFEMMRDPASLDDHPAEWVILPAPRDLAHIQPFAHGRPTAAPRLIDPAQPPTDLPQPIRLRGHRAAELAAILGAQADPADLTDIPAALAAVAAWHLARRTPHSPPSPVYVRPPDAAPPSEAPPVLLP